MHDDPDAVPPGRPPGADEAGRALTRLRDLITRLRGPDGCPWDRRQDLADLRSYLLEEAHEVASAIDSGKWGDLRDELGDLLFQAVFVAEIASERDGFRLEEALEAIHDKMVARHPHVFGEERLEDADAVQRAWERRKVEEERRATLAGIPETLPSLVAAYRIGQKVGGVGFDWREPADVRKKVLEELREVEAADSPGERREEIGDLLFAIAQWARHLGVDPEAALAAANGKFRRRFGELEEGATAEGLRLSDLSVEDLESRWQAVKERARRRADGETEPGSPR